MDFKELDTLVDQGFLRRFEDEDLIGYGYTDKCTFARHWNALTLNARGTVYNKKTGEVVAQAFPKFFNWEELSLDDRHRLIKMSYQIFDKVDGSLGILFHDGAKWRASTRGSFNSEQAIEATKMLSQYNLSDVNTNLSFLVEIIYPENKIILDYGKERKLVLLSVFNRDTKKELPWYQVKRASEITGIELVKEFTETTIENLIQLQKNLPLTQEGFVVRFENGERVKFKGHEYLKIAKLISGLSPLTLWENMVIGLVPTELLQQIPEEFLPDYLKIADKLEKEYERVENEIEEDWFTVIHNIDVLDSDFRKNLGLFIKNNPKLKHPTVLFNVYLTKRDLVDKYIKKIIRPNGNVINE